MPPTKIPHSRKIDLVSALVEGGGKSILLLSASRSRRMGQNGARAQCTATYLGRSDCSGKRRNASRRSFVRKDNINANRSGGEGGGQSEKSRLARLAANVAPRFYSAEYSFPPFVRIGLV